MKFFNICLILCLLVFACNVCLAQEETAPKRPALPRRPLVGKGAKTTTTTTPAPALDGDEGDYPEEGQEQYGDEGEEASSTSTTTTEAPKKVGPVIRPFRSNDDLLNSLKRRQMNAKKTKAEKPTPKSKPIENEQNDEEYAPAPAKTHKSSPVSGRRKFTKPVKAEAPVEDVSTAESEQPKEETRLKRPQSLANLRRRN